MVATLAVFQIDSGLQSRKGGGVQFALRHGDEKRQRLESNNGAGPIA
jgi:hypothetical protein